MPPRIPTRILSSLQFSNPAVASSSTLPLPPRNSPPTLHRPLSASSKSRPHNSTQETRLRNQHQSKSQVRSFHSTPPTSASAKDPYNVLGVKKDASASDIKKSYYQLAKKWHPDSNKEKGANERFLEIQNAYDILSDDTKRQAYDQYGSASQQEGFDPSFGRGAGGFGGFQDFGSAFGGGRPGATPGDLFEQLFGGSFGGGGSPFGGGGSRQRPTRGDDLEASITLSFMEACNGLKKKITITPVIDCKPCHGSGLKPGEKKSNCTTCRGTGQQTFSVQGMVMASTCQACGGSGTVIPRSARCGECEGVGRVKERKEIEVEVPGGIEDGMKIKIPGSGDMPLSSTGPPGDLFVRISVKPSSVFRRQGTNLYHDAKVPLHTALLGGRMRIPTLEGDVEVRVREGTQNGEEAVLKGRGVKSVYGRGARGERGDLVVGWKIQIPRSLSSFQKKILRAYADDVEGKTPEIYFERPAPAATSPPTESTDSTPPPPPPPSSSAPPPLSSSTTTPPPPNQQGRLSSSSHSPRDFSSPRPKPEIPFVETESPPSGKDSTTSAKQDVNPTTIAGLFRRNIWRWLTVLVLVDLTYTFIGTLSARRENKARDRLLDDSPERLVGETRDRSSKI